MTCSQNGAPFEYRLRCGQTIVSELLPMLGVPCGRTLDMALLVGKIWKSDTGTIRYHGLRVSNLKTPPEGPGILFGFDVS